MKENPVNANTIRIHTGVDLPLDAIALPSLSAALTFQPTLAHLPPVHAFHLSQTHATVPRFFLSPEQWPPLPILDARPTPEPATFTSSIQPRDDDQRKAMEALVQAKEGVVELACGRGKTVVALHAIAQWGTSAFVVVPSLSLVDQWRDQIRQWLGVTPSIWYDSKRDHGPIVIATLQTLVRRTWPDGSFDRYGVVIFDECHHLAAPAFHTACMLFPGRRVGLTATVSRSDGLEGLYLSHLGRVVWTDLSTALTPEVVVHSSPVDSPLTPAQAAALSRSPSPLSIARTTVEGHQTRNGWILSLIDEQVAQGRRVLCLAHTVSYLRRMHARVPGSGLCIGSMRPADRRRAFESQVVFATYSIAAEGLDSPRLDTLFLLTPFRSPSLFQQAVGRVLRSFPNKQAPTVHVIRDSLPILYGLVQAMIAHAKARAYPVRFAKTLPTPDLWNERYDRTR